MTKTTRRDLLRGSAECRPGEILTPTSVEPIDLNVRCGFPDMLVEAHTGKTLRFYEDRIQGKAFMLNFFSLRDEGRHEQVEKIARIAEKLGDVLGKSLFISSVTVDPAEDTVERLAAHAARHGVPEGWLLLRAEGKVTSVLAQRMYHFNRGASAGMGRLVFYGNAMGKSRAWGTFPTLASVEDAAHRVRWVLPKERQPGFRIGGPARPGTEAYPWNHRARA